MVYVVDCGVLRCNIRFDIPPHPDFYRDGSVWFERRSGKLLVNIGRRPIRANLEVVNARVPTMRRVAEAMEGCLVSIESRVATATLSVLVDCDARQRDIINVFLRLLERVKGEERSKKVSIDALRIDIAEGLTFEMAERAPQKPTFMAYGDTSILDRFLETGIQLSIPCDTRGGWMIGASVFTSNNAVPRLLSKLAEVLEALNSAWLAYSLAE